MSRTLAAVLLVVTAGALAGCAVDANGGADGARSDDPAYEAEAIDSMREVLILAHDAGVTCAHLPMAGAIAKAESGLNTRSASPNGATSGCPSGSVDRGLWQINSCYHAEVSASCAFDGACNARAMVAISSHGSNWSPWSTYWNGAYKKHLGVAAAAYASGVPGCTSGGGSTPPAAGASCFSHTLGKTVGEHTCVQSRYDSAWYTCLAGRWAVGEASGGSCSSRHPL